ncbi:acyltransferase family protein [Solibacillus sp. FSL H8-0538]|uniref:acyltransferase family protein n=1 Tax=Solibacillus sp. FSL H8-0538 TaxID=2921400 RepID=UPI0030F5F1B4
MTRDSYYDNAKAILIVLVVFGHTLSGLLHENRLLDSLYMFIYIFHMPAFIFISGYFSKTIRTKNQIKKLIATLVIPYIIFQLLYSYYYIYYLDASIQFNLFDPRWGLWFLISLFYWKLMLRPFATSKWMIAIAILISLTAGYIAEINEYFSLSRTLYFFVYFVAGYHMNMRLIKDAPTYYKNVACGILVILFVVVYFYGDLSWKEWFLGRLPYEEISHYWFDQLSLNRLFVYGISAIAMLAFLMLIPQKQTWYTYVGQRTMGIYIFHLGIIQGFRKTSLYEWLTTNDYYLLVILFVILIIWSLSFRIFTEALTSFSYSKNLFLQNSFYFLFRKQKKNSPPPVE